MSTTFMAPQSTDNLLELTNDALTDRLTSQAAMVAAETANYLLLLAEFDRREAWAGDGVRSCAHWLNWQIGTAMRTGQEQLRVAHALTALPRVRAAFGEGRLSYSRVRAITRVATPDNEAELIKLAMHSTGSQLERLVRVLTDDDPEHEGAPAPRPRLSRSTNSEGQVVLTVALDPADAELVWKALHGALAPDGERELSERRADALVAVADAYLSSTPTDRSGADRTQVVIHQAGDLYRLEDGTTLHRSTALRLSCDASSITIEGEPTGTRPRSTHRQRRSSGISEGLRRQLTMRDGGCVWPGCNAQHHLHAHHVIHRADGGPTTLTNLALLCGHHHRILHADGYRLERMPNGEWRVLRQDGSAVERRPLTMSVPRNARRAATDLPPPDRIVSKWAGDPLVASQIEPLRAR